MGRRVADRTPTPWEQPQPNHRLLWNKGAEHYLALGTTLFCPLNPYSKEDLGLYFCGS